jgi:dethiobiotin synthetase
MQRPLSLFVTGTDTEIGKTLTASALLHALSQRGFTTVGMKPVAAGAELRDGAWHNEDVDALDAASTEHPPLALRTPYLLRTPAAPHIAAALEGVTLSPEHILGCYQQLCDLADAVVVEGVGGFRVPLTEHDDTADLSVALGLPVVMVVGLRLGCINQALLTQEAVLSRGLKLVGWVANSTQTEMAFEAGNIDALRARITAPLLGHVPRLARADAAEAARHLDLNLLAL